MLRSPGRVLTGAWVPCLVRLVSMVDLVSAVVIVCPVGKGEPMAKAIRCSVCKHPKRREIDAALRAGMVHAEVQRTLCPEIKRDNVDRHFRMDHHTQELGKDWTPTIETIQTKSGKRTKWAKRTRATRGAVVKVHWELPRDLVKRLKHKAVDAEVPVIELVRGILEGVA